MKIKKCAQICNECLTKITYSDEEATVNQDAKLTLCKARDVNKFNYIRPEFFDFFLKMELICRRVSNNFTSSQSGLTENCLKQIRNIKFEFGECADHRDLKKNIMDRFDRLRCKISVKKKQNFPSKKPIFSSYSLR